MHIDTANSASHISSTLHILLTKFDGQVLIPFSAAAKAAGFAVQTARNLQSQEKFPIRSQKRGGRRFVHISDLAAYIESLLTEKIKRGPGRPTKVSVSGIARGVSR